MQARLNPIPESAVAQRLLAAASEVMARSGEASLRVQDVIETAGVQAPVLYRHFGSREGLVQSVYLSWYLLEANDEGAMFSSRMAQAESKAEFRSHCEDLLRSMAGPNNAERRRIRLEVLGSAVGRPELAEFISTAQRDAFTGVALAITSGKERGWVRADLDPGVFVIWASSTLLGLGAVEQFGVLPDPTDWWIRFHLEACSALLFGPDES